MRRFVAANNARRFGPWRPIICAVCEAQRRESNYSGRSKPVRRASTKSTVDRHKTVSSENPLRIDHLNCLNVTTIRISNHLRSLCSKKNLGLRVTHPVTQCQTKISTVAYTYVYLRSIRNVEKGWKTQHSLASKREDEMTADKARRHDARTSAASEVGRDRGGTNLVGSVAVSPTNVHSDTTGAATSGTRLGRHGPDGDRCVRAAPSRWRNKARKNHPTG